MAPLTTKILVPSNALILVHFVLIYFNIMFAAYSQDKKDEKSNEKTPDQSWLQNDSFQIHSSFSKESFTSAQQLSSSEDDRAEKELKATKHKDKKKKKKKKKDSSRSVKEEREYHRSPPKIVKVQKPETPPLIPKGTVFSNGLHLKPHQAFYEDAKGDRNNLSFPNLYFKYVAKYCHSNYILGGKVFKQSTVKKSKSTRYFHKRAIKRMAHLPKSAPILPQPTETNPLGIYDANTVLFLQGQKATTTEESIPVETEKDQIMRQTTLFNEKLRKDPHDIQLWKDFIEFQDTARFINEEKESLSKDKPGKSLHQRALLERKISILDKAIGSNPKNEFLINFRLQIAAEYWDLSTLQSEWRNTLFAHPMSIHLWKKYLSFSENFFEGFSVQQVLKTYSNCIKKLIQIQNPSFTSHTKPSNLEENMIDIFMRLCSFLRQSGLTEKSISLIQAFMELSLERIKDFQPSQNNFNSSLSVLQTFWGSYAPRIGEESSSKDQLRKVIGANLEDAEDSIIQSGQSHAIVWHRIEYLRSMDQWQAWTPVDDEDECDDVERRIPFTDLSPYLFYNEKEAHLQFRVVVGSLQSLGMPLLPALQVQLFWAPVSAESDMLYSMTPPSDLTCLSSSEPTVMNSYSYLSFIRRIILQSYAVLADPYRLELILNWLHIEQLRIETTFRLKPQTEANSIWKETKGWIKNFLKTIPPENVTSTLLVYHAYTTVERAAGNVEESGRISKMLLSVYKSNPLYQPGESRAAILRMWFSYIKFLMCQCFYEEAFAQLVALGGGSAFTSQTSPATPAMILKARRKYESLFSEISKEMSFNDAPVGLFHYPDEVVDILGCFSYFLSMTEGSLSAYKIIHNWLAASKRSDFVFREDNRFNPDFIRYHTRRESVFINQLELLSECRSWVKDFRPSLFHDTMDASLTEYPHSMKLLSKFIQSEERCNMFSHLWKRLSKSATSNVEESPRVALAACLALAKREEEIKEAEEKSEQGIATLHLGYRRKIEHLVEECVSHYPGRHNATLWRLLMRSAHLRNDQQRCRAVFYRAVRDCPWSRDIYMDIIEYVPGTLKEVVSLLQEKELRLRFPLEELDVLLEPELDADDGMTETETQALPETGANESLIQDSSDDSSDGNFSEEFEPDDV